MSCNKGRCHQGEQEDENKQRALFTNITNILNTLQLCSQYSVEEVGCQAFFSVLKLAVWIRLAKGLTHVH